MQRIETMLTCPKTEYAGRILPVAETAVSFVYSITIRALSLTLVVSVCSIQRFSVIPLSTNSGLIGWVPHCDTLHSLIRDYREKKKILLNIEHRIMLRVSLVQGQSSQLSTNDSAKMPSDCLNARNSTFSGVYIYNIFLIFLAFKRHHFHDLVYRLLCLSLDGA